jgi:hypothetical protein
MQLIGFGADGCARIWRLVVASVMMVLGLSACADRITGPREVGRGAVPTIYALPAIDATTCRYGGEYPACNSGPLPGREDTGSNPGTEDPYTPEGGSTPPPEPADTSKPPPCQTDNPVLNDANVQTGLDTLWKASNPDARALGDRRERFAWIIQTAGGYELRDMGITGTFCGIDASVYPPPEGKGAVVGWVHTHPYHDGETVLTCGSSANQIVGYNTYSSAPSDYDRSTAPQLAEFIGKPGLPGYLIDTRKIVSFVGRDKRQDRPYNRCGY